MIHFARPLSPDVPLCAPGHHPQLVESRGTPPFLPLGTAAGTQWHVECAICQVATVPHPSKAITESRWRDAAGAHRIPLSELGRARAAAIAAHAT